MQVRFFIRLTPLIIARRFENGKEKQTEIFNEKSYSWDKVKGLYYRIIGLGGDSDYSEMTLSQAREIMGYTIPEHFTRADKFLFMGLPEGAADTVAASKKDLIIK